MPIYSIAEVYPIYEKTAQKISPSNVDTYPAIEKVIYWVMRIDGELKNGGVAQLIWNLHESYDYELLYEVLEEIGASAAKKLVEKAVAYIYKTKKSKESFFANGPFGVGKTLENITNKYYDLSPSVEAQLLDYIEQQWQDPTFQKTIKELNLEGILKTTFNTEQVFETLRNANIKRLQQMLAEGLDPNLRDDMEDTLLMNCISRTDQPTVRIEMAKLLVQAGADLEATNDRGTVLNNSCFYGGNLPYLKCLVELGANIEHPGVGGKTPAFFLTRKSKNLTYFIQQGVNIHYKTAGGLTPLGDALLEMEKWIKDTTHKFRKEYIKELKASIAILLEQGAMLSEEPIHQYTPIHQYNRTELSCISGDSRLLKQLIEHPSFQHIPEWTLQQGVWTVLHEASKEGNMAGLKSLLEAGLPPNPQLAAADLKRGVFAGATPLDLAKNKKVELLLQKHGAKKGTRLFYSLYLKTRGEYPKELAAFLAKMKSVSLEEGLAIVHQLPKQEGKTYEWDEDDNIILFKELLLDTYSSQTAIEPVVQELKAMNVITQIL